MQASGGNYHNLSDCIPVTLTEWTKLLAPDFSIADIAGMDTMLR